MTEENNYDEKLASEDSKLDSLMSVLIILAKIIKTDIRESNLLSSDASFSS